MVAIKDYVHFFGDIKFTELRAGLKNTIKNYKSTGFNK